jgi:hypothetical protein
MGEPGMEIKEGDIIRRITDGIEFTVKKVFREWFVLKSENGKMEIVTGDDTLNNKSLYQKEGDVER